MISLENEAIMIRKEIKNSKFVNQKQGYSDFVGSLTRLREDRSRSTSNNRLGIACQEPQSQLSPIDLSNQNH